MSAFLHTTRFFPVTSLRSRASSCISLTNRPVPHIHACRAMATRIPPPAVQDRLQSQSPPLYIDVRTPKEFADGHVPAAVNVPVTLGEGVIVPDFVDQITAVATNTSALIIGCKSGKRSTMAIELLQKAGVEGLVEMDGGFDAWMANSGLPIEH